MTQYTGRLCPKCGDGLFEDRKIGIIRCERRRMPSCDYMEGVDDFRATDPQPVAARQPSPGRGLKRENVDGPLTDGQRQGAEPNTRN